MQQASNLIAAMVAEFGGPEELVTYMVSQASSEATTDRRRFQISKTLLHLQAMSELAQAKLIEADREETPQQTVQRLHQDGQLIPAVREMLETGMITLDDVDPPPDAEV